MTAAPPLLAGKRRGLAALLAVLALGEAVLTVLFAAALDRLLAADHPPALSLLAAGGCAAMIGAALLLQRWVGEDFAQGFVADCRAAIFEEVTCHPGTEGDARWLTVLLNDMAALRNYALRGTVRLWTSVLAASAAALWVGLTMPQLRPALLPLLMGAGAIMLLVWPLSRAITGQRQARGRLNRFLVRRVRAELSGNVSPKGHGFGKLATLSHSLAQASVRRARRAGTMDAVAALAGLAAALAAVWELRSGIGAASIAGSLTLLGFIAARLLDSARALHARAGGRIALARLERLLASSSRERDLRTRRTLWARWARWVRGMRRAGSPLALPGPAGGTSSAARGHAGKGAA
jgi:hypothetical protein